jgi:hypothetical protein
MRRFHGIVVAIIAIALSMSVAVAATAATSGSKAGKHGHHAKKKKKKKKTSIKVKCAVVICKSHPGPTGPAGPQGAPGAPGGPGANGYAIVARARSIGPLTPNECTTMCPDQSDPLTGNTWVQQPTESDHVVGSVTYTHPSPMCTRNGSSSGGSLTLLVLLDGNVVGFASTTTSSVGNAGSTITVPVNFGAFYGSNNSDVFETGTANSHTVTVQASDNCHTPTGDHFTVNSVGLDVEAYS